MNRREIPLKTHLDPGLYLCAVPIGNARDITLRVLDILENADVIAAEDTRSCRKLMEIHGIAPRDRPMLAYHDHSGEAARDKLIRWIAEGKSVAYLSEAGTPLVADPGYKLAAAVRAQGLPLTTAPGASAALAALTVSGLPSDAFHFVGFLPTAAAARRTVLETLKNLDATIIVYESPKRIHSLLGDLCDMWGRDRKAVLCRELTKKFEEVLTGSVSELLEQISDRTLKGELVVLLDRDREAPLDETDIDTALRKAMTSMRVKDAATAVAGALGVPRRQVYQRALELNKNDDDAEK